MQQPNSDHLRLDVAIVVKSVYHVLAFDGVVVHWPPRPDRFNIGVSSFCLVHRKQSLPEGLVEVMHTFTALCAADGSPLCHQLQVPREVRGGKDTWSLIAQHSPGRMGITGNMAQEI